MLFPVIVRCDRNGKVPLTVPDELPLELHNTGTGVGIFLFLVLRGNLI